MLSDFYLLPRVADCRHFLPPSGEKLGKKGVLPEGRFIRDDLSCAEALLEVLSVRLL